MGVNYGLNALYSFCYTGGSYIVLLPLTFHFTSSKVKQSGDFMNSLHYVQTIIYQQFNCNFSVKSGSYGEFS